MNSYQRVMTALELRQPDRVPIVEWSISPKVFQVLCPDAKDQADFEEMFGLDAACVAPEYQKVSENPDGTYVDEWGVTYKRSPEVLDHPFGGPIQTAEDLRNYVPPDPDAPHRLAKLREVVARFKGRKALVLRHRAAFMWSVFLNGFGDLLANFLLEPAFAHQLLDMVLEANLRVARNALRAGADIILVADDYAGNRGPFFSRAVFEEFILPRLQRMVNAVHAAGGKAVKHSDGNLWPILDDIVNTGVDAINPLEPVAGMDIGEVKRQYGHRVCLIGNIDCSRILSEASVEEVEAAVRECIAKAAPGGGFILSSSNSIHSSVKPENYLRMIEAARKYGHYPLSPIPA